MVLIAFGASFTRTFAQSRDVKLSDTFFFQVRFKYLDGVETVTRP